MSFAEITPGVALSPGQLGGMVIDASGAVIPGAQVEVQNTATRATWNASTTADGRWFLLGIPSGVYQISASAPGFQTTRQAVSYNAANPAAYRLALNVGSVSEQIVVESTASRIDTDASAVPLLKDKKHKGAQPTAPPAPPASANVFNLQQRVAGVLPVAVDVPRTGTSYRFFRPLIVNEETKLSFTYKSK